MPLVLAGGLTAAFGGLARPDKASGDRPGRLARRRPGQPRGGPKVTSCARDALDTLPVSCWAVPVRRLVASTNTET